MRTPVAVLCERSSGRNDMLTRGLWTRQTQVRRDEWAAISWNFSVGVRSPRRVPKDSPQLAGLLAQMGLGLSEQKKWTEAEPLLRECLAIREKTQPDVWSTFNTKSLLGGTSGPEELCPTPSRCSWPAMRG